MDPSAWTLLPPPPPVAGVGSALGSHVGESDSTPHRNHRDHYSNHPLHPDDFPWLVMLGEPCYSDKQIASGMDLSNTRKKYKKMYCSYCAEFNSVTPWAQVRPRKFEKLNLVEHEKSAHHEKANAARNQKRKRDQQQQQRDQQQQQRDQQQQQQLQFSQQVPSQIYQQPLIQSSTDMLKMSSSSTSDVAQLMSLYGGGSSVGSNAVTANTLLDVMGSSGMPLNMNQIALANAINTAAVVANAGITMTSPASALYLQNMMTGGMDPSRITLPTTTSYHFIPTTTSTSSTSSQSMNESNNELLVAQATAQSRLLTSMANGSINLSTMNPIVTNPVLITSNGYVIPTISTTMGLLIDPMMATTTQNIPTTFTLLPSSTVGSLSSTSTLPLSSLNLSVGGISSLPSTTTTTSIALKDRSMPTILGSASNGTKSSSYGNGLSINSMYNSNSNHLNSSLLPSPLQPQQKPPPLPPPPLPLLSHTALPTPTSATEMPFSPSPYTSHEQPDSPDSFEEHTRRVKRKKLHHPPDWAESDGPLRYSDNQIESGKSLKGIKRKYKLLQCKICHVHVPNSPWAVMRPRKFEAGVFEEHERSSYHRKAIELQIASLSGSSSGGILG